LRDKLASATIGLLGLITLGYTVTRGGVISFFISVVYGLARFGRRAVTVLALTTSLFLVASQTDLGGRVWSRIIGERGLARLDDSVDARAGLWQMYLHNFTVHYLLFGRGITAEFVRNSNWWAHNTYIGAFAYTGLFGAVILAWIVIRTWRMGLRLAATSSDPHDRSLGESLAMCILGTLVAGVAGDLWQVPQPFLFALIALVDIRLRAVDALPNLSIVHGPWQQFAGPSAPPAHAW
jgi:hypothetical protein